MYYLGPIKRFIYHKEISIVIILTMESSNSHVFRLKMYHWFHVLEILLVFMPETTHYLLCLKLAFSEQTNQKH